MVILIRTLGEKHRDIKETKYFMKSEDSQSLSSLWKHQEREWSVGLNPSYLTPDTGRLLLSGPPRDGAPCWPLTDSPVSHQPAALASTMDCLMCDLMWLVRMAGQSGSPGSYGLGECAGLGLGPRPEHERFFRRYLRFNNLSWTSISWAWMAIV